MNFVPAEVPSPRRPKPDKPGTLHPHTAEAAACWLASALPDTADELAHCIRFWRARLGDAGWVAGFVAFIKLESLHRRALTRERMAFLDACEPPPDEEIDEDEECL